MVFTPVVSWTCTASAVKEPSTRETRSKSFSISGGREIVLAGRLVELQRVIVCFSRSPRSLGMQGPTRFFLAHSCSFIAASKPITTTPSAEFCRLASVILVVAFVFDCFSQAVNKLNAAASIRLAARRSMLHTPVASPVGNDKWPHRCAWKRSGTASRLICHAFYLTVF